MRTYLAAFMLVVPVCAAQADEPLAAPAVVTTCSTSQTYCAISDPDSNLTVVSVKGSKKSKWQFPHWHRWLFVSNDGNTVVAGYDGMNLVPENISLDEPVLFFYHRGTAAVQTIKLGDLYRSKSDLRPTVSHYAWVDFISINAANQLVLHLADGRRMAFAVDTAKVQEVAPDVSK
jgi:hypothetical protein